MDKIQRLDTHEEDPERRKDEADIVGKMMNMIGSLRDELAKLWTRNEVLEKELSQLRPREDAVSDTTSVQDPQPLLCGDESDRKETQQSPAHEGDGGEAVTGVDDVCPEVKCVHCDSTPQEDKSCCGRPACEECDEFGKFAKKLGECEVDV
jgi:hypothetical protein